MKLIINSILIAFAAILVVSISSCQKHIDPKAETNNMLNGDWEVESFTLDGTETIGSTVNSFEIEFTKQGPYDGETEWTIIYDRGDTEKVEGDYEIKSGGAEIDIDGDELEIILDGDRLELEGNINGSFLRIKAERD